MARTLQQPRNIHNRYQRTSVTALKARAQFTSRSQFPPRETTCIKGCAQKMEQAQTISSKASSMSSIHSRPEVRQVIKNRAKLHYPGTTTRTIRQTYGQCFSTNPCNSARLPRASKSQTEWPNPSANSRSARRVITRTILKLNRRSRAV